MSMWTSFDEVPFRVSWIDVGEWRTRVLDAGSGPVLVLLHGTGGHLEAFTRNIRALTERFRVIAYDMPGHGYTTHAHTDIEIGTYVDHLAELLTTLGISRAHLCGESLGGWVAIKFAEQYPTLVDRMVLNTPGGTMATPEVMERIRSLSQAAADDPSPERVRSRLEWLMADNSSVTDELVEVRRAIYARPGFSESMKHILCLQNPAVRTRNLVTEDTLGAVIAPTLVVWTSDDPSGPATAGRTMAEQLHNGSFALIENAGHWPQWEQQELYDQLMLDFLARSEVPTS
ncbi:alpha/beta fold hydrolase [Hoyosella subflava]|uniref:Alpha/beta hydrolase fold protein n=1 Tax=Hoyosella subflava (strain DSM 45089 / JCM 17490 / NBRC 109087 / DQS3-9A1) TaxID=443218 RepID=F6EF47_HOYSD|nr:alpha/beta hydrolase [Hoyosella subflava]AEF38626.1 Alpha/beta hydrolase fold protein [Hoyosella subflava DQS3-9A1]